ncbi:MAG: DUF4388 domain-containing protein [Candidatus Sericytochromatia bacterium]|nr:DUF4388 domain-containing protein [Candidatus Sericytochromatia bacterium]
MKFSGRFADFSLPDILRILIQSQKTGALNVQYHGHTSLIFVNHGALHHAESERFSGSKAVFNMLNFDASAEFEFVEDSQMPPQTIDSDLDTLIQNGISYQETWRRVSRQYPRMNVNTEVRWSGAAFAAEGLSANEVRIAKYLSEQQQAFMPQLLEQIDLEPGALVDCLLGLETRGLIQVIESKSLELRRFFLEMANTLLAEFNSISGMKLKQEMTERLEKLIQENNWKIDVQNGRIVDDKMHSSDLSNQTELYSQYLGHLLTLVEPIYGKSFLQQVMQKVDQNLEGAGQLWVKELKLEL